MSDPTAAQQRDCEIEHLDQLKADAVKAAAMLRKSYGNAALERARQMERRSPGSLFARLVTAELLKRG